MSDIASDRTSAEVSAAATARIAIVDLADEMQVRKQWIFKIARRLGIQTSQRREAERGNQFVATVSTEEATAIRGEIEASIRRGVDAAAPTEDSIELITEFGAFYVIQLEPEHDPGRVKVGFTTDLDGRLRKHRCSAPFAICAKSWPCRRTWERAAIDCVTVGLEQLHSEVFRAPSVADVSRRGDEFFKVMPRLAVAGDTSDGDSR
ncbi:MAG: hypothetical protein LC135_09870 [Phycisphaerae bacterium]|nr:hypothetical protein [Phycisphaerae bacterium]MCZ2400155.1 hypothetical protein [Phycisphaerae bacterium]NUQ46712.1 hypothetical protein [Phycisphaerae bacterium]